jgi:hypothetical protein
MYERGMMKQEINCECKMAYFLLAKHTRKIEKELAKLKKELYTKRDAAGK